MLMLSCRCYSTEPVNYAKIKGRESEFLDAIAKAESACGIKKSDGIKSTKSCVLAYWIGHGTNNLFLETVLVGIKTNEAHPQSRLIVAWRNILQYDSSWDSTNHDDVDYGAVVWRKNHLLSNHGFSRKEIENFWKQVIDPNKAGATTLLDWLFLDNIQHFSNDKK